ncbi:MAG TPA: S-layer homology domain-containing protein [Thermoleophilia bacterium]|nr:S-layer homology domain-containing protein [Thermoleophilia bacterium]
MRIGKRRISKRLVFILVPVVVVLVGGGSAFAAVSFTDISGNTHEQSIINMANRGITTGFPDGTFRPNEPVTRGQMMTFLDRNNSNNGCTDCHNEGTELVARAAQMKERSVHGTGEAFEEGTRGACAGCHGTEGSKARINAGLPPHDPSVEAIVNVSPMGCRTCHDIHFNYTGVDWALTGDADPVKMEYSPGTYDKGAGNLCANCHQSRNAIPAVANGQVNLGTNTRFGQHYSPQATILLGEQAMGGVVGSPSIHYTTVEDSCASCHMGEERNHTMEVVVGRCTSCHPGLTTLDRNGVQTEIQGMLDQAKQLLIASGIMNADDRSIPGIYAEGVAASMWNYKLVATDASKGIHNPAYARALLQYVIDTLQ